MFMKCTIALTTALLLNGAASIEEPPVYLLGVGPLIVRSEIEGSGKSVRIHATATNESGVPIRYVRSCVRNLNAKANDCAGVLDRADVWQPEAVIRWDENLRRPVKSGAYRIVAALLIPAEKIDLVGRIYVDLLDGSGKDLARDQLMAAIVNTHRFELVGDRNSADAILQGRAEIWKAGSESSASARTTSAGGALASRAAAIGGSVSNGTSQGSTKTIFDTAVVLRLTLPTGESIWAWDDSKDCSAQAKAKCAIDDLMGFAAHPPVPAIR
jgi:hypothetical protein